MSFLDDGTLIVCGDYQGAVHSIVEILNGWIFDNTESEDQLRFLVPADGRIHPDKVTTCFPTALPYEEYESEDEDELDGDWVALAKISKKIASLLTSGSFELVAVGHYKTRFVYFERLTIHCDGRVKWDRQQFESFKASNWHTQESECNSIRSSNLIQLSLLD